MEIKSVTRKDVYSCGIDIGGYTGLCNANKGLNIFRVGCKCLCPRDEFKARNGTELDQAILTL